MAAERVEPRMAAILAAPAMRGLAMGHTPARLLGL